MSRPFLFAWAGLAIVLLTRSSQARVIGAVGANRLQIRGEKANHLAIRDEDDGENESHGNEGLSAWDHYVEGTPEEENSEYLSVFVGPDEDTDANKLDEIFSEIYYSDNFTGRYYTYNTTDDDDKDDDSNDRSKEPETGDFGWGDSIADWDYGGQQVDNETYNFTNSRTEGDQENERSSEYQDWYEKNWRGTNGNEYGNDEEAPELSASELTQYRKRSDNAQSNTLSDLLAELEREARRVGSGKTKSSYSMHYARPRG